MNDMDREVFRIEVTAGPRDRQMLADLRYLADLAFDSQRWTVRETELALTELHGITATGQRLDSAGWRDVADVADRVLIAALDDAIAAYTGAEGNATAEAAFKNIVADIAQTHARLKRNIEDLLADMAEIALHADIAMYESRIKLAERVEAYWANTVDG